MNDSYDAEAEPSRVKWGNPSDPKFPAKIKAWDEGYALGMQRSDDEVAALQEELRSTRDLIDSYKALVRDERAMLADLRAEMGDMTEVLHEAIVDRDALRADLKACQHMREQIRQTAVGDHARAENLRAEVDEWVRRALVWEQACERSYAELAEVKAERDAMRKAISGPVLGLIRRKATDDQVEAVEVAMGIRAAQQDNQPTKEDA